MRFEYLIIIIYKTISSSKSRKRPRLDQNANPELENTTNICYFNSLLQCLYNSQSFFDFITKEKNKDSNGVTSNMRKVITYMSKAKEPIDMFSQLKNILYNLKKSDADNMLTQQDVSELFVFIIDKMFDETRIIGNLDKENFLQSIYTTKIIALFYSHFYCRITCQKCQNFNNRDEIRNIFYVEKAKSVQAAIDESTLTSENIKKDCEKCKISCLHKKESQINYQSQIITICIKIYNNNLQKINDKIFIEEKIVLSGTNFTLVGFIEHRGNFLSSGHYIAYASKNGTLVRFNDSSNKELKKEQKESILKKGYPFMLFYEKIQNTSK
ncbi:ubiquitin carboxyl terminal hydrolase [Hamiltosporidium tvaerminnensis]|uniref:ubiquitinyl hydrolase 1 n=2 Tax=Hamiltosporidium TaxID=1176354 RepID=A0A4Q9LAP4_9MICR|nr:ubiquitin carboxyl terminal hydrolase [Hamiltosporidium magnivora]TBU10779.1 ubiquitin carboxyl terminal hydrolase [Hamiltosporidium tvaerminnensis]